MGRRIALTDGSGKWFDEDSAALFKEQTQFDGRNQISMATGDQWEHEYLYFTKSGHWVLNHWSNWQGSQETYVLIDEEEAVTWLTTNECFDRDNLKSTFEALPFKTRVAVQLRLQKAEL